MSHDGPSLNHSRQLAPYSREQLLGVLLSNTRTRQLEFCPSRLAVQVPCFFVLPLSVKCSIHGSPTTTNNLSCILANTSDLVLQQKDDLPVALRVLSGQRSYPSRRRKWQPSPSLASSSTISLSEYTSRYHRSIRARNGQTWDARDDTWRTLLRVFTLAFARCKHTTYPRCPMSSISKVCRGQQSSDGNSATDIRVSTCLLLLPRAVDTVN